MNPILPYQDSRLPTAERVADLLGRMTLTEKVAQLIGPFGEAEAEDGQFSLAFARQHFQEGIAYINTHHRQRRTAQTVAYLNALQRFLREETRLGIPALGLGEGLHGYMAHDATSFPQAIALASTWDPALVERVFTVVAREMRARGAHYVLSPVLDLALDPRWGRTEETYGEDPHLAARLGVAAVRGLQGPAFNGDPQRVLATAKHFAAHGQPEAGTNAAPANYAERTLRELFLAPFRAAVQEAGVGAVMAAYHEINGIPCHINPWLLGQVLREEWGFDGFVISDGWGVDDLYRLHFVAADAADAARQSLLSGVDVELGRCFIHLAEAVHTGRVPQTRLDEAVSRILTVKFQLGLFEDPYVDPGRALHLTNHPDHQALALEAARKALVLLKNEGDLLPLDPAGTHTLAVIGPNAAELRLGGYSGDPGRGVTILDGIQARVGQQTNVLYAEGCRITEARNGAQMWYDDELILPDPAGDTARIAEAVAVARQAQVALLVLGDNEQTCREGWSADHLGDRDSLDLPGRQEELLRAVLATGTPVILLLLHGRPASIPYAAAHVPAILEGWYLGQAGGTAVAELLFGDTNPGGKLPITIPRSVGQVPAYYHHKPSARRGYLFSSAAPLFPFGHGLSYTTFAYAALRVTPPRIRPDEAATVSVVITNSGRRAGDEVVQLYIRDELASVTRPVKLLKGFRRITLQPGESQTVTFPLTPADLALLDEQMQPRVEPGRVTIMVGGSSETTLSTALTITA